MQCWKHPEVFDPDYVQHINITDANEENSAED